MNQLKVHIQQAIAALNQRGWSNRRIARELGLDRGTINRWLRRVRANTAISHTGSAPDSGSNAAIPHTGPTADSDPKSAIPQVGSDEAAPTNAAISHTGSTKAGRQSLCEPWREQIEQWWQAGLSVQRIYQDLVAERQFSGSYHSVRRLVRHFESAAPLPFRRIEVEPGSEAQVDFGQGAWVVENGKRRRPHLFRVVLSCSRKAYSEVVWRQTTENFIRCLENSFRHFGGVPRTLVIDNLRAAVSRADWFDPELNPKVVSFCEHYGTSIWPNRPGMPRHKGKVESSVKYSQNNAVKGRQFESLGGHNLFLSDWETNVADKRIHGTTKQQVARLFEEVEKPKLLPLPASLFPTFEEAQRGVHLDGHVEVEKAYYSAPPEYVGRRVWARWEPRLVRLFNDRMEQIALHTRKEPGQFATDPAHIDDRKRTVVERGAQWLLDRARCLGKYAGTWAEAIYAKRGALSIRVLHGLLSLAEKHPASELERACQQAVHYGAWRLRDLRQLLHQSAPPQLTFLETHPLIRDLAAYENLVPVCFDSKPQNQSDIL